jgi:hypothetical protein
MDTNSNVAVYQSHEQATAAVATLREAGIDVNKISIVGKDYHTDEHVTGYYNAGDRMKYWGKLGAFWGGFWGLLLGTGFFFIPGIGPVLVAGPVVAFVVAALEGAAVVGGLSVLGAALYSLGIPKDSILQYEVALKSDQFLIVVHGTADEVTKSSEALRSTSASDVTVHEAQPAVAS